MFRYHAWLKFGLRAVSFCSSSAAWPGSIARRAARGTNSVVARAGPLVPMAPRDLSLEVGSNIAPASEPLHQARRGYGRGRSTSK